MRSLTMLEAHEELCRCELTECEFIVGWKAALDNLPEAPEWEYGMRFAHDTKAFVPTPWQHIQSVKTWHNGIYAFARRIPATQWEEIE